MNKTLTLHLQVEYSPNGENTDTLKTLLLNSVKHLTGEGLLTGETAAEVQSWQTSITEDPQ